MTLRKLIFDERDDAHELYEKGFKGEFTYRKVRLVCIYMHLELGYGVAKIKTEIIKFCRKQDPYFNPIVKDTRVRLNQIILKAMKADDYDRTECPVIIRQGEIEAIRKIKNFKQQKTLLAMLFLVKSRTYFRIFDSSLFPYVREMLSDRSGLPNQQMLNLIHDFIEAGFLKVLSENTWTIEFMEDMTVPVFTIYNDTQAKNLVSTYVKLCGGELGYCKICGNEFIKGGVRDLYCTIHRNELLYKRNIKTKAK
jgi:hypothetical protein